MHYFIDGYNFLFQLYEEIDPLREKREEVIQHLQGILQDLRLNATIVFDSHHRQSFSFPTRFEKNDLEIIYTPSGQTADAYIIEALTWNKHNHTKTVVTSDKHLAVKVKSLGAKVLSIDQFIKMIIKKSSLPRNKETKVTEETPHDFKRLLEAFEKRFKEL
jgi:predicted RNA-binding protein with PIN domain